MAEYDLSRNIRFVNRFSHHSNARFLADGGGWRTFAIWKLKMVRMTNERKL